MRRMFWLTLGAAMGVSGYRKVTRMARALTPARPSLRSVGGWQEPRGAASARSAAGLVCGVRGAAGFARDVQEGMRLYRFPESREVPTLEGHGQTQDWAAARAADASMESSDIVKDGH